MEEKQVKQVSANLKSQRPAEVESIATTVKSLVFGKKCEVCGLRPIAYGAEKTCNRCIKVITRKQKLKPEKVMVELTEQVGEAYLEAELDLNQKALILNPAVIDSRLLNATGDIFLWGDVGVGKTWMMAALLKHYLCEGFTCQRVNFDDFCCRVRATMNNRSVKTEYDLIKKLVDVDKLFIDDLGLRSKAETDFAYVTFFSILDRRQERYLPTYISTNKTIDQLKQSFDTRIASRLGMGTVIEMKGEDRRQN